MGKQWRLSWEMWPHGWPRAHRTEKIHDDESAARMQHAGLLSILADHPPRPCREHVWNVRLEEREASEWTPLATFGEPEAGHEER